VWRHTYQRHIRATAHVHRKPSTLEGYVSDYQRGATILSIARRRSVNYSPYLLARIILEHKLRLRRSDVGAYVRDPSIIPDARLRAELVECMDADEHSGPRVDQLRAAAGKRHEALLELGMQVRGIPFQSETALRERGYAKTPDALAWCPDWSALGATGTPAVINWIDSKATLGEPQTFMEEHLEQV